MHFAPDQRRAVAPFHSGRQIVAAADDLAREHGSDAALAASLRAAQSRARDNAAHYCHWREVERLVEWLNAPLGEATRH